MTRRQTFARQNGAQGRRRPDRIAMAEKGFLAAVKPLEFGLGRERSTVHDIIGAARKTVIGEDRSTMFWRDQKRRDGKILIAMCLRGQRGQIVIHRRWPCS